MLALFCVYLQEQYQTCADATQEVLVAECHRANEEAWLGCKKVKAMRDEMHLQGGK